MNIKQYLQEITFQALGEQAGVSLDAIEFEHPANPSFGDYSTNIALKVAQNSNPRQLAQELAPRIEFLLREKNDKNIASVTVAGPGFINFTLSDHFLLEEMEQVLTKSEQLVPTPNQGKKVVVEFTDPNPFKQFHIGHLYSNTVGEAISRLLEATGAQVRRVNYFGDVGVHVAKSVWGMNEKIHYELERSVAEGLEHLADLPLTDRVKFLGQAYAKGDEAYRESEKAKAEITTLNKLLYVVAQDIMVEYRGWQPIIDYKKHLDPHTYDLYDYAEVRQLFEQGKAWSLAYFNSVYDRVGMAFDEFYPESQVAERGVKLVEEGLEKGVFTQSQGAIVFEGEKQNLHTRVFINSSGLPTYEAKELGLAPTKYEDDPYDLSVIVTANEINEYFQVLIAVMKELRPELGNKTMHFGHGMVRLPEGKMSSRTGNVITGEWLLDEAHDRILKVLETTKIGLSESSVATIAEAVGQAAIKYAFLRSSLGKDIAFSFDESLSFQGNSGPYLQYTAVRCQAVLKKAAEVNITDYIDTVINTKVSFLNQLNAEEKDILLYSYQYSEVIMAAAAEFAPHYVSTYLFELAQRFNAFYTKHQIVGAATKEQRAFRLALTQMVLELLRKGLHLLNIQVVEQM